MPTVSVIIPTCNRANYLKNAIESVIAQTFQDWELVVVDDGSTDDTAEFMKAYRQKGDKIRYVRQNCNQGVSAARNRAIRESSGKYVAFLDDDDQWFPYKLELQVSFMETHPDYGMCYSQLKIISPSANGSQKEVLFPPIVAGNFLELLHDCHILPSTAMVRRSCVKGDWFNPKMRLSEDQDLWLRLAQRTKIEPLEKVLATTIIDGRVHAAHDYIAVRKNTISLLKKLELVSEYRSYWWLKERHIARIRYELGRDYLDLKQYWMAAKYFAFALMTDPLVGLMVRRPGEQGFKIALRLAKSYAAVPLCLLKGIFYANR